ncbi:MAG: N-succinylarginine dihydrolase [Gammaproteobacteria bacterium]|nr:N-succinylarginine dihydrolase [Gammaproteobacteria bacterium]
MNTYEVNFDGLVGPSHNYSGLAFGNKASKQHAHKVSNPKEAAKQGLLKMKTLHDLGIAQGVLAPQERPAIEVLRRLGFAGSDRQIITQAWRQAPHIFTACCSASSMWAANAATVSPSADSADNKVHFTPANLIRNFHRTIEADTTDKLLRRVFSDPNHFQHHNALPSTATFGDEGAANHTRLCEHHGGAGIQLFIYGKQASITQLSPRRYPARQTLEASQAISRLHQLDQSRVIFAQQNPAVIDAGVFHNDVIAVGNENVLFFHQRAFLNKSQLKKAISKAFTHASFHFIEVENRQVSVEQAVNSYLFNSQLVTLPKGGMALIAPRECEMLPTVRKYLQRLLEQDNPIKKTVMIDVKQSMCNGGGPACLRLRVALTEQELASINQAVIFSNRLFESLNNWIDKHYRDRLCEEELADPRLLQESRVALDELTQILALGSLYPFQQL